MSFIMYINHWNEVTSTDEYIFDTEKQFKESGYSYKILNASDKDYDTDWTKIGPVWFNKSLHYAMQDFMTKNYDYFGFMNADIISDNWKDILDRTNEILNLYHPASYSIFNEHLILTPEYTCIKKIDEYLQENLMQDGSCFFYKKDIVIEMLKFFEYLDLNYSESLFRSGWGVDFIFAAMCLSKNEIMLKDAKTMLGHKLKNSSQHFGINNERDEIFLIVKYFIEYCKDKNIEERLEVERVWKHVIKDWFPWPFENML